MPRPLQSKPWTHVCKLLLKPSSTDKIEYCKADERGLPDFRCRDLKGRKATVIIGHKEKSSVIKILPEDQVWTCDFNLIGHLSGIGIENKGKELTVIVH
jgi:hypothetical protein